MIPNTAKSTTLSNIDGGINFSISTDLAAAAHIFKLLTEKLYTNKPWAIVREYGANAIDANISAGNGHLPIVITLPSAESPIFSVRDYGPGLDRYEMEEIYVKLGDSTKRFSNEFTGQMGIGCKSGFAYGNFTIAAVKEGDKGNVKTIYQACRNQYGGPILVPDDGTPTDEPSGLEIIFEIRPSDFREIVQKSFFFADFCGAPVEFKGTPAASYKKIEPTLSGDGWKAYNSADTRKYGLSRINVRMGSICYPCRNTTLENEISRLVNSSAAVVFDVKMGEVDFSASREELEYTDRTIKTVNAAIKRLRSEAQATIDAEIKDQPNIFAAHRKFKSVSSIFYANTFTWNGIKSDAHISNVFGTLLTKRWNRTTVSTSQSKPVEVEYKDLAGNPQKTIEGENSTTLLHYAKNEKCVFVDKFDEKAKTNQLKAKALAETNEGVWLSIDQMPPEYGTFVPDIKWADVKYEAPAKVKRTVYKYGTVYEIDGANQTIKEIAPENLPSGPKAYVPVTLSKGNVYISCGVSIYNFVKAPFKIYGLTYKATRKGLDAAEWLPLQDVARQHFSHVVYDMSSLPKWFINIEGVFPKTFAPSLRKVYEEIQKSKENTLEEWARYTVDGTSIRKYSPEIKEAKHPTDLRADITALESKYPWLKAIEDIPNYYLGHFTNIL